MAQDAYPPRSTSGGTWGDRDDVDMGTTAPQAGDVSYYDGTHCR